MWNKVYIIFEKFHFLNKMKTVTIIFISSEEEKKYFISSEKIIFLT